jgi:hypothetical protein
MKTPYNFKLENTKYVFPSSDIKGISPCPHTTKDCFKLAGTLWISKQVYGCYKTKILHVYTQKFSRN